MLLKLFDLCPELCHGSGELVVEPLGEFLDLRCLPVLVTVEGSFVERLHIGLDLGAPARNLLVGVGVETVEGVGSGAT